MDQLFSSHMLAHLTTIVDNPTDLDSLRLVWLEHLESKNYEVVSAQYDCCFEFVFCEAFV